MYVLKIHILHDKGPNTYRIVAECVASNKKTKKRKCKTNFSSASEAEAGIKTFIETEKFNIRALTAIFSFRGRRILPSLLPTAKDKPMNINLQYGSVAERAFKRVKRITAWDRLEIHDWMHDVDL